MTTVPGVAAPTVAPSGLQKLLSNKLVVKIAGTLLEDAAPKIEAQLAKIRAKLGGEPLFWLAVLKQALSSVANILPGPIGKIVKLVVAALTFLVGREVVQPVVTLPAAAKPAPVPPPKTVVDAAKAPTVAAKVVVAKVAASKPVSKIKGAVAAAKAKLSKGK